MKIEWHPAKWQHIEAVLADLSDQHEMEYRKLGYPSEDFMARFASFLTRGETRCMWFNSRPQCFISIAEECGVPTTWLGLTKDCINGGAGPIRAGRKYIKEAAKRHGVIVSYITSEHPQITRWMTLLGAELKADDGRVKLFAFNP